ncbi:hypothetical protein [Methanospirillum purgamenti]|uniref:hypothetical protein n=1 Tax=Methanospirillum purgamenti TaxID=2834276 RepID=UPI002A24B6C6|nr:hypothetical protein [Methanospirillum hungatei]
MFLRPLFIVIVPLPPVHVPPAYHRFSPPLKPEWYDHSLTLSSREQVSVCQVY